MKDIVETKNNVKTKTTKTHKFCKNFMNEIIEAAAAGLFLLNAGYLQKNKLFFFRCRLIYCLRFLDGQRHHQVMQVISYNNGFLQVKQEYTSAITACRRSYVFIKKSNE